MQQQTQQSEQLQQVQQDMATQDKQSKEFIDAKLQVFRRELDTSFTAALANQSQAFDHGMQEL